MALELMKTTPRRASRTLLVGRFPFVAIYRLHLCASPRDRRRIFILRGPLPNMADFFRRKALFHPILHGVLRAKGAIWRSSSRRCPSAAAPRRGSCPPRASSRPSRLGSKWFVQRARALADATGECARRSASTLIVRSFMHALIILSCDSSPCRARPSMNRFAGRFAPTRSRSTRAEPRSRML